MTARRDPLAGAFAAQAAVSLAGTLDGAKVQLRDGATETWDVVLVTADPSGTLLDLQAPDGRWAQLRLSAEFVKGSLT